MPVHNEPGHLVEQLVSGSFAPGRLQEELHVLYRQLPTVNIVVLVSVFLGTVICQAWSLTQFCALH